MSAQGSAPASFEQMWRDLAPVGRSSATGGYFRQPWLAAELELRAWFREAASARGLPVEEDVFGNLVAWWHPAPDVGSDVGPDVEEVAQGSPDVEEVAQRPSRDARGHVPTGSPDVEEVAQRPSRDARGRVLTGSPDVEEVAQRPSRDARGRVLTGSHLDSVLDGGAYDGPLGVVSAFAAIDVMRERGVAPARPLGVAAFVEEEGSRFGLACLGSRLAAGTTSWTEARGLVDRDGVRLGDVVAGPDDDEVGSPLLDGVGTYVELHVEQGRGLVDQGAPVGVASGIWPHGRYRFDLSGRADHAGTTRMEDRVDPMLTYAMTALAANKQARLSGQRATFGRVEVRPNGTNAVPSHVTAWLDARADSDPALAALVAAVERQAADRAGRDGTAVAVTAESVTAEVAFDLPLRERLGAGLPVLPTQAGHDAGILQAAGIRSGMLFVRNPTGVSHSPEESAATADCLAGVEALADALARLVT